MPDPFSFRLRSIEFAAVACSLTVGAIVGCSQGTPAVPAVPPRSAGSSRSAVASPSSAVSTAAGGSPAAETDHVLPRDLTDAQWAERIRSTRWICYYPSRANPKTHVEARPGEIARDLHLLRRAGFTGLITYTAEGTQGKELVRLAGALGFRSVILGVWDPKSPSERAAAADCAASPLVVGYVVGNEGYQKSYTYQELQSALTALKAETGLRCATTEEVDDYTDEKLLALGDWIFPNVHPYFHNRLQPDEACRWTVDAAAHLKSLTPKLVFLKEVGLPTAGDRDAILSPRSQDEYYQKLAGEDLLFAYFEFVDLPWKDHLPVEPHWGLFHSDLSPKALALRLLDEHRHVVVPSIPELDQDLEPRTAATAGAPLAAKTKAPRPAVDDGRLLVDVNYTPSVLFGDVGDVSWEKGTEGGTRFTYRPRGQGPHEWDGKYDARGQENEDPARHAGCLWVSPPNEIGQRAEAGYDLTRFVPGVIRWEARRIGPPVHVQFTLGGGQWQWSRSEQGRISRQPVPFPDSLPSTHLGTKSLGEEWETFECPLDAAPPRWDRLVAGFGWAVTWDDNAVPPRKEDRLPFVFEVRNIRFEQAAAPAPAAAARPLYVYRDASDPQPYRPTGLMGDCGDIHVTETCSDHPYAGKTCLRIVYDRRGAPPHACDYPGPCRWAGVYWQQPPGNWGKWSFWRGFGRDLSAYRSLKFWARADEPCSLVFFVGGIDGPEGDSLSFPRRQACALKTEWQEFEIPLRGDLRHLVGGFGFSTSWDDQPRAIRFDLDEIRFEP